jgi:DNA polymerase elongation subunit (family B)
VRVAHRHLDGGVAGELLDEGDELHPAAALGAGEDVDGVNLPEQAEAYETQTPQVRAARLLGWTDRRGRVDYVMTRAGPEPVEVRSGASLDYEHYLERQLRPIAQSIAQALGTTADEWLGDASQLGLFASPDAGR